MTMKWSWSVFVSLLLITAGTTAEDNPLDAAADLLDNAQNLANDAVNMAKTILENTGFDTKDLPKELMTVASTIFQVKDTEMFQSMLQNVKTQIQQDKDIDVSNETLQNELDKLLTNENFVGEVKVLMDQHNGNMDDPGFKSSMETVMQKYLQGVVGRGAKGIAVVSFTAVLMLVVFPFLL